jgi:ABC-type multidrug transport system fused ATPase/permease subunit
VPIQVGLGILDLLGVILLGTVGTLGFKILSNDSKPTRLEIILKSIMPTGISTEKLTVILACIAILVLGTKTALQAFINFKYINFLARLESDLSGKLFSRLIYADASKLNANKYSDYQYSLTIGANRAVTGIIQSAISFVSDSLTTILMSLLALYASPLAFLLAMAIFGLTYLAINGPIHRVSNQYGERSMNVHISLTEKLLENFRGIKDVRVYKKEDRLIEIFNEEKKEQSLLGQKVFWISSISRYFFEFSILIAGAAIIAVLTATTDIRRTVTVLVIFIAVGYRLIPNIQRIQNSLVSLRIAEGATSTFFEFLDKFDETKNVRPRNREILSDEDFEFLELEKIGFNYPDNLQQETISNISFKITKNSTLAVIGESGSGKTTLADIISGINFPTNGKIRFNRKIDVNTLSDLKPSVGYVSQSTSLFGDNIYENIAFGSSDEFLDTKKIEQILSELNLDFLFTQGEGGSIRNIRSDGTNLSGGERQRISIARVEYANPSLIVFDEPTSSLDEENKSRVTNFIKKISGKKTIVIVTHSLDLLEFCDHVLLMRNGRLEFFGSVIDFKSRNL